MESEETEQTWHAIGRDERRVLGVLVEKAKTTPEAYPLTLNSLTNGCNQKNNRFPKLDLEPVDVQNAIAKLTPLGAVSEVPSGRVEKFRHHLTDWLGVSSVELAVMAELLLRGAQTVGDLRGRANRMSSIASVAELRPIVQGLMVRDLIVPLTEPGRGQAVTHNLYADPEELSDLRREFNGGEIVKVDKTKLAASLPKPVVQPPSDENASEGNVREDLDDGEETPTIVPPLAPIPAPSNSEASESSSGELAELKQEVADLRAQIARIKSEIDDIWANVK